MRTEVKGRVLEVSADGSAGESQIYAFDFATEEEAADASRHLDVLHARAMGPGRPTVVVRWDPEENELVVEENDQVCARLTSPRLEDGQSLESIAESIETLLTP